MLSHEPGFAVICHLLHVVSGAMQSSMLPVGSHVQEPKPLPTDPVNEGVHEQPLLLTWHQEYGHRICALQLNTCPGDKVLQADLAVSAHQEPPHQHPCSVPFGACLCEASLAV